MCTLPFTTIASSPCHNLALSASPLMASVNDKYVQIVKQILSIFWLFFLYVYTG